MSASAGLLGGAEVADTAAPAPGADPAACARLWARWAHAEVPWLHTEVAARMADRLRLIRQVPAWWLDWGASLGAGAGPVKAVWPQARRQAVEPTPALLARSQAADHVPWWRLPRPLAPHAPPCLSADLPPAAAPMLWANLVLPFSADPAAELLRWREALAPGGLLMFTTYGPDTLRDLHTLYAAMGWPAPQQPFPDMHDVGDWLVQAGFAEPVMDQEMLVLSWSSPEALLQELRGLGANLSPRRPAGLRTPRWRQRLCDALAQRAGPDGRISLGFELVYGHAYKGQPRAQQGDAVAVDLSGLRRNLRKS